MSGLALARCRGRLLFGDSSRCSAGTCDESVDLVYLDPPFGSDRSRNAVRQPVRWPLAAAQVKVSDDAWRWTSELAARTYDDVVEEDGEVSRCLRASHGLVDANDMLVRLSMASSETDR